MAAFAQVLHTSPRSRRPPLDASALPDRPDQGDAAATSSLAVLVAGEIIPRLILAHRADPRPFHSDIPVELIALDVADFTPLALAGDPAALFARVERLLSAGVPAETLMVDLLAPAARMLGTWWEEDRCDFVEVTMGLWRLQEVVRHLATRTAPPTLRPGRRALFAAFPGDQHDFGAAMVSELFRRHGWDAEMIVAADMTALLAAVGHAQYDVVGLTISCDCNNARVRSAILALRSVSRNPYLRVMVGGRVPNEDPMFADRVGADATAADARNALRLADVLVGEVARCASGA